MSYEDTKCPCGGKKERETMLSQRCVEKFQNSDLRHELTHYRNGEKPYWSRRSSAMLLLSAARKSKFQSHAT